MGHGGPWPWGTLGSLWPTSVPGACPQLWVLEVASQESDQEGIRAPEPAGPSVGPWARRWGSGRRDPQRQEGRRRLRSPATSGWWSSLSGGPGEAGSGPPGGWAGRAWLVRGCFLGLSGGVVAGEGSGAPGSCGCVCCSGHHNPSSQLPGSPGRRKDLWWWLSKPKGFRFSLGSLGSVVLPRQAAQLPGSVKGLGCPLPSWSPPCRTLAGREGPWRWSGG